MKNINKILVFTGIIFLIFFIIFFQKKSNVPDKKETTKYDKINIDFGENVYTYKDYIYIYGKNGIKIYQNTKEVFSETFSVENPYIIFKKDKIAIADKDGKTLRIYNKDGFLYSISNKNSIISASINQNGYSAIISKNNSAYEILVFDFQGNNIFTLTNITYKEGIPINLAISEDNSALVVSFLKIDNAIMESNISVYSLTEKNLENNSVFGAFKKQNQFCGILRFLNENKLLVLSEQEFSVFSINAKYKDAKEIIKVPFKNKVNFISFLGDEGFVIGYGKPHFTSQEPQIKENTICIYNFNGGKISEIFAKKNITNIFANENGIIFCEDRLFKGYSPSGSKIFEYQATQDIKDMQFFASREKAFIVTESDIKIFKVSKKNISNLQEKNKETTSQKINTDQSKDNTKESITEQTTISKDNKNKDKSSNTNDDKKQQNKETTTKIESKKHKKDKSFKQQDEKTTNQTEDENTEIEQNN